MADLSSNLILRLMDRVTGPARGLMGTMNRLQGMAQRANRALMLPGVGMFQNALLRQGAAFIGIYGLGRAFTSASRAAGNFEAAMIKVRVLSGATGEQFQALERQALELGRTTQFTASQAADAQGFLAMAGFKTDQILGAMPGTLQLAAAAQMDLGRSADIVSNILSGYRLEVADLGRVNDVLVQAFSSSNTDLQQLGEALKYAGPVASAAGIRFEEAAAALGLMGNAGIQGSMAGTSLRGAISRVLNPTAAMTRTMRQAGLRFTDAQGRMLPLVEVVRQLEPHAEDAGLMMELFGQRAGPAMAALVSQGSSSLAQFDRELQNSGGRAQEVADSRMQGLDGAMRRFSSAAEGAQIAFGKLINPGVERFLDTVTGHLGTLTEFFDSLPDRVTIFDRMSTAWQAFSAGFSGKDGTGIIDVMREARDFLSEGLFGTRVDRREGESDTDYRRRVIEAMEDDANALARMSNTFRGIGRDFRSFIDAMAGGEFGAAIGHLTDAFRQMNGWGSLIALYGAATGINLLASAVGLLIRNPVVQVFLMASAIAALIDAAKGAESLGEFAEHLQKLSTFEWVVLAAGLGLIGAKIWGIANGLRAMKAAGGLAAATPGVPAAPKGPSILSRFAPLTVPTAGAAFIGYGLGQLHESFKAEREADDRRFASPRGAERSSLDAWRRYEGSGDFADDMDELRHQRGQRQSSGPVDVELANASLSQLLQPGDQIDVNVLNPPPRPNVTVGPFTIYTQPGESATDVGRRIGREVADAVEGAYSDGGM